MNAPTFIIPIRNLSHVLIELKQARRDFEDALQANDEDAEDRATEAEQRIDALRDEFGERFEGSTGLTWKIIETAIQEALL